MPDQDPNEQPEVNEAEGGATPEAGAPAPKSSGDAGSLAEEALRAATEALEAFDPDAPMETPEVESDVMHAAAAEASAEDASSYTPPDFDDAPPTRELPEGLDLLADVNLNVKIELGRTKMLVEDVLRLGDGSVVELDKLAGDPVDIYVNDRPVARGEVLVLNDNFCVRISEIISHQPEDEEAAAFSIPSKREAKDEDAAA